MSARHHLRLLTRTAWGVAALLAALSSCAGAASAGIPEWTTYHHDATRSGIDPDSGSPLAPARVWQTTPLDGRIYAEPLVYGARVYVATENDTVYSLEAATGKIAWGAHLGAPVPSTELPCGNIEPVVGITSTPVIDPATNTIYAVTDSWDGSHQESIRHRLVALDLSTGAMLPGFPIEVDPPFPPGGSARQQLQRAALALDGNEIVVGYGGNDGDCGSYWGWLVAGPKAGAGPLYHFQVDAAKGHHGGAIWGSGNGPAVDSSGHIYTATGNGYSRGSFDYSESVLKLEPNLTLLEYWAPEEWLELDKGDTDLGSSDPVLLSNGFIFQIGKQGVGLLLRANALGGITKAVSELNVCGGGGSFGGGIYLTATANSGTLYLTCSGGLHALSVTGLNTAKPEMSLAPSWHVNGSLVGPPIFAGGLVWVASSKAGTLYGLDPSSGAVTFGESLGTFMHFATPSAGGGRLFAANDTQVTAFRIATAPTPSATTNGAPPSGPAAVGVVVSDLRQSHAVWREGNRVAQASNRRRARAPVGTVFSFSLNERVYVNLNFTETVAGRKVGRKCVAKTHKNAARKACKRTVTSGTLTFLGHSGTNKVIFQGRISRARKLKPGRYSLVVTATNTAGQTSVPQKLRFTIVK